MQYKKFLAFDRLTKIQQLRLSAITYRAILSSPLGNVLTSG